MAVDLESAEFAAFVDMLRAAPDVAETTEVDGATCAVVRRLDSRMFNRVVGLRSTARLDEIAGFYGEDAWWISDSHGLGPSLERLGFVSDYGWMKFSRGVAPRAAHSELRVIPVGPDRAAHFARVILESYELPGWTAPLAANVVGRAGWSCYVAYDGDSPAGTGALYVCGGVGWLGFGATLPQFRGRGVQSAILAARIEDARIRGCSTVVTETGELAEGRPATSYRNILRAGFREVGVRPNYRAPSA
jgi:GNAT superfamily N-acetyltransferase